MVTVSPDVSSSHQPRRLGEQGGRLVARGPAGLVRRRRRDDPALAREAQRPAHRARHRRDQPGRGDRRARRHLVRWGQPLLPIGVLYDPFVERALEPWSFGIYAGGQSILVGTPSGVTLAAEGGAHQSIKTPSIGLEQPGCVSYEPAFALDTEWCLLAALGRLGRAGRQLRVPAAVDPAGRPGAGGGAVRSRRARAAPAAGRGGCLSAAADGDARRHPRRDGRGRARGAGGRRAAGRRSASRPTSSS